MPPEGDAQGREREGKGKEGKVPREPAPPNRADGDHFIPEPWEERGAMTVTLPASPNHELSLDLGWVKREIFSHREGLVRNTVHIERDPRDFHVEDVVVPLLITDLREAREGLAREGPPLSHPETPH